MNSTTRQSRYLDLSYIVQTNNLLMRYDVIFSTRGMTYRYTTVLPRPDTHTQKQINQHMLCDVIFSTRGMTYRYTTVLPRPDTHTQNK